MESIDKIGTLSGGSWKIERGIISWEMVNISIIFMCSTADIMNGIY